MSSVIRSSMGRSSCNFIRPAERRASLSSASSRSWNGSRFCRIDPDCNQEIVLGSESSGPKIKGGFSAHHELGLLGNDSDTMSKGLEIHVLGQQTVIQHIAISMNQTQEPESISILVSDAKHRPQR